VDVTYRTCKLPARIVFKIYTDGSIQEEPITFSFKTLVSCEIENNLFSALYTIKLKNFRETSNLDPDVVFPKYNEYRAITWDKEKHSIDYFLSNYEPAIDIRVECYKDDTFVGCYPVYKNDNLE
jgi:hypothetical protein